MPLTETISKGYCGKPTDTTSNSLRLLTAPMPVCFSTKAKKEYRIQKSMQKQLRCSRNLCFRLILKHQTI